MGTLCKLPGKKGPHTILYETPALNLLLSCKEALDATGTEAMPTATPGSDGVGHRVGLRLCLCSAGTGNLRSLHLCVTDEGLQLFSSFHHSPVASRPRRRGRRGPEAVCVVPTSSPRQWHRCGCRRQRGQDCINFDKTESDGTGQQARICGIVPYHGNDAGERRDRGRVRPSTTSPCSPPTGPTRAVVCPSRLCRKA